MNWKRGLYNFRVLLEWISIRSKRTRAKGKIVYLIMTPRHQNLGDHALAMAEYKFMAENFPECNVIEVSGEFFDTTHFGIDKLSKIIKKDDVIAVNAGGSLGTLWPGVESVVRDIIIKFKENNIIIMPQTLYFSDDSVGEMELEKSKAIYSTHSNLYIFAREKYSYMLLKKHFTDNKVGMVPDMALLLDGYSYKKKRDGALLCLRNDKEKTQDCNEYMIEVLRGKNIKCSYTDTCVGHRIPLSKRVQSVESKLEEFASARLVVTDRLHGMVFAAITETPCVIINSRSYKIQGVYEWIQQLPYLCYLEDMELFSDAVDKVLSVQDPKFDNEKLKEYYLPLIESFDQIFD